MVSFKKLLLAGTALFGAVSSFPQPHAQGDGLSVREPIAGPGDTSLEKAAIEPVEGFTKVKKAGPRALFRFCPAGQIEVILGFVRPLPAEIQEMINDFAGGAPGAALYNRFREFLTEQGNAYPGALDVLGRMTWRSVEGTGARAGEYGVQIWAANTPDQGGFVQLTNAIVDLFTRDGGDVSEKFEAANFFDPNSRKMARAELEGRDGCPGDVDVLSLTSKDVNQNVNENDYNTFDACE